MKGSGRQASWEPDHKHPAWETNEKNWETNERKWETSRPGTRPDHPAPRRPFFKALRTPNSKTVWGMKSTGRQMEEVGDKAAGNPTRPSSTKATIL